MYNRHIMTGIRLPCKGNTLSTGTEPEYGFYEDFPLFLPEIDLYIFLNIFDF